MTDDLNNGDAIGVRIRAAVTDRRHLTAATSLVIPTFLTLAIGISGTAFSLIAETLLARPWAWLRDTIDYSPLTIALLVLCTFVFPLLYFVTGGKYGIARSAFRFYSAYRELVAEIVIDRFVEARRAATGDPRALSRSGTEAFRAAPAAVRWLARIVLFAVAGERLNEAFASLMSTSEAERADVVLVAAVIDDILTARLLEPARNLILFTAVANALALALLGWNTFR
jgi:hypothetical protein